MKAMLFAAGLGTRLKPFTDEHPKALLPLGGKTLLQWQIEKLRDAGIRDIVINVHYMANQIVDYLKEHNNFQCHISISDESERLLETGGGLNFAQSFFAADEPILACNVDVLSNIDLQVLQQAWSDDLTALLVVSPRETQRYLLFDAQQRLCGWMNKATNQRRPASLTDEQIASWTKLAFSGMQVLSPRIFDLMKPIVQTMGEKFSLIDLYLSLLSDPHCYIHAYVPTDYRMMDVGKTEQLTQAEQFALSLSHA